jgi:hypothetical protein
MDPPAIPIPVPIIDLRYRFGKTYYIHSPSHPDAKFYIGSTIQKIKDRKTDHKSKYKGWLAGKPGYCSSFEILKLGDAVIVKLEDYPCNNKLELELREKEIIKLNRTRCVNIYTPAPTAEERKANRQAIQQAYAQSHVQERKAYNQARRQIYVICECGERVNKQHKARHLRSKKHITAMENLNQ